MKNYSLLISFALIFLLMDAVMAQSPPQPGCVFYGNVTVNGGPAEDGLNVTAVIGGASVNWTAVTKNGTFQLGVPSDNADSPEKDGGVPGDTVGFYVNNTNTGRTANFVAMGAIEVDLSIGNSQPRYTLTVKTVGSGVVGTSPVQASYLNGTIVTLTASAYENWTFSSWSGDVSGTANPINVSITGNRTVTATFVQQPRYTLTVKVVGSGVVGTSPVEASYLNGTIVTLTASAYENWTFSSWSGDVSGTANPINVSITGNRAATATFVPQDSAASSPSSPIPWYVVVVILVGVVMAATVVAFKKGYRLKKDVDTSSHTRKK